jgi:3-isopropylmalate dehydrogenase
MANPIATVLSAAFMLRYSFNLLDEAKTIEEAIAEILRENYRTYDIMSEGKSEVGTKEMGDLIAGKIAG